MGEISISSSEVLALTKDLIRVPSVTGDRAALHNALDVGRAQLPDFPHETFVEPSTGTESVLFFNTETRPEEFRVLLMGHVDVVPALPEQFNPSQTRRRLKGRGAQDMKPGVAGEIIAFQKLAKALTYSIGLLLVTDEEVGGFHGTKYVVDQGVRAQFVLAGESTDLKIKNEFKGVFVLEAVATGKAAHAAYPHQGDNAAVKMARFVVALDDAFPTPSQEEWVTTLNISGIDTHNPAHNKIPHESTSVLDFRHTPSDTKESIRRRIEELVPEGIRLTELTDQNGISPYTDPSHPDVQALMQAIEKVKGKPAEFKRGSGSSDVRHFAEVGAAAIDFGPSGGGLHSDNEYGDIESYGQFAQILVEFLTSIK